MTTNQPSINFKKGMKVYWNWGKKGYTPGTIKFFNKRYNYIIVEWDDNTSTKCSPEFLKDNLTNIKEYDKL